MTLEYYDKKGNLIIGKEFGRLFADRQYQIVKQDDIENYLVSTVWLGLDHSYRKLFNKDLPIQIFETMVFKNGDFGNEYYQERYSTEEEAIKGHEVAIQYVKDNFLGERK